MASHTEQTGGQHCGLVGPITCNRGIPQGYLFMSASALLHFHFSSLVMCLRMQQRMDQVFGPCYTSGGPRWSFCSLGPTWLSIAYCWLLNSGWNISQNLSLLVCACVCVTLPFKSLKSFKNINELRHSSGSFMVKLWQRCMCESWTFSQCSSWWTLSGRWGYFLIWDFQKVTQALESNILVFDCLRKLRFSSIIACNCVIIASSIGKAVERERSPIHCYSPSGKD